MTLPSGALACQATPDGYLVALSGVLTMDNVGALYRSMKPLDGGGLLTLDASDVTGADSSALALITTITRLAREQKMRVALKPFPPALSSILQIYGLEDILSPDGS